MQAQVISFHCVLKDGLGKIINTSFSRDVITNVPGVLQLTPGLPAGLNDVRPGERRVIAVKAQDAFGIYDPALAIQVARGSLSAAGPVVVGNSVHLANPIGEIREYRITKIVGDQVYLDANHPLAGRDLSFDVHIVEARNASDEELRESSSPAIPTYLH